MTDLPVLDTAALLERLGGSRETLAQLEPVLTQSAQSWRTELPAALTAGDTERLRRTAHQAKGAMLTFAAPRAAAAALRLEELAKAGNLAESPGAVTALLDEVTAMQAAVRELLASCKG